jgi:amino acid adenylation domain-containing protein
VCRSIKDAKQCDVLPEGSKAITNPDLAYILFTSGSSGTPKGVLIEHTALATTILENGRQLRYSMGTRTLSFAAYTFDVSVMEIYLTLLHGGCLFIPSEEQRLGNLCGYMNDKQIEMAFLTPTAIRNLLQAPSQVPSLKTLRAGGEPLPQTIVQQWSCYLRLINSYGPTEACVDACRNAHITPITDPNNIGYPIGTHLWVVEPGNHSQLAPVGCPGELLISGPTLARGYLNDEEKTRGAFIDGSRFPWILSGEDRFYTTGDIVRQNSDGSINFIGRRDLQMKLNGFRIEPEEVEFAVERCEGVAAAVVDKVSQPEHGGDVLVAFFTMAATESQKLQVHLLPPTDSIQSIIRNACTRVPGTLPPYMVPQFYLPVDRIPLTISGKADRGALRHIFEECSRDQIALYRSGPVQKRDVRTTIQRILQGLWAQVLSLEPNQIGLDSEFVSLGGESLAAIKLATMCREIGFGLDIADILRNPRLEDVATHVERGRKTKLNTFQFTKASTVKPSDYCSNSRWGSAEVSQMAEACGVDVTEIEDIYPCTPIQEALMAVTARHPQAYIARELFQLPSSVNLARFQASWELVHESNPILRTRICSIATNCGFENVQVVCKCRCDWVENPGVGLAHADMGLGTSLIRYRILKSPEGLVCEVLKHHSIYDGFSGKLLWDDFRYAFTHLARPPNRPPYRQYVDYLNSLSKEKAIEFWKDSLEAFEGEHFPTLPFPEYIPKATSQSCQTVEAKARWNASSRFTFATVARAAWAVILSMRSREPGSTKDICFAATLSGRTASLAGLEDMTGPTITTVPVRVQLDLDQTIDQYLGQIHDQAISMLPFEHFGFSQIRGISDAARDACKVPNLLVVQPAQLQKDVLPLGLTRITADGGGLVETFGLVIECIQSHTEDSMSVSASYDPLLMTEREVRHLLQQLFQMITQLNNHCTDGSTVRSTIWSLADGDDFQRAVAWNRTSQPSPSACLHELMEESARRHPDRLAIDAHDGRLRYGELNAAADALAATLQDNYDIKPGDLVPICFEKSSSMILAILGILKAGAGYVPLDISHPSSRMEYIIREIGARLIVVSPLQAESSSFPVPTLILKPNLLLMPLTRVKRHSATPRDVAYVTFTSGTSGPPKGVVTEHGASCLSVLEHGKRYQHHRLGSSLRALQFSSYTFDASVLDIFATIAYCGCLCIPSEQDRMGNLEDVLARMEINFADLTPTVANLLEPSRTPTLRGLAIGGEMANRALITKWTSSESPLEVFVNSYGPTEAAIGCAAGEINPTLPVGNIGKRVGGSLWIVDEANHNQLVPVSCVGELVISGPTLARGYLNDSERTNAAFIKHVPWLARIGEKRLYKTGDLARFDVDGNVEILGRKEDGQIKLHGLRLELGEIEAAIRACQCFSAAQHVAAARVNMSGNPTLAAFIRLPGEYDQAPAALSGSMLSPPSERHREIANKAEVTLRGHLPEYMIPRLWLPVSSWPLVASGKTDRKCLAAACEALSPAIILEYQRPCAITTKERESVIMTKTEKVIEDAWKQVLRKENGATIGPQDDFFKLGGDSLSTIMLIAALRAKNLHITAQEIFMAKSLRNMAQLIDSKTPVDKLTRNISTGGSPRQKSDDQTSHTLGIEQPPALSKSEIRLRSWWASVLNRPEHLFLRHDDFFGCGGDSLAVLRLSRIAGAASIRLSGADIYAHPTLSEMANLIPGEADDRSPRTAVGTIPSLGISKDVSSILAGQTDIEDILPASHTQLSFLIEGQKWCRAYYAWSFIEVDVSAPVARVQEACRVVAQRHQILRTSFHLAGRQCYQAIRRGACDFKVLFYNGFPDAMCTRLDQDVEHPVFFEEVLTRFRLLIDTGSDRQILALGLSHAQYDGFCLPTILDDLRLAYTGKLPNSRTSPIYHRFIEHTLQLSNENTDTFWRETLKGAKITSIVRAPVGSHPVMDQSVIRVVPFKFKHSGNISYAVMLKAAWALVLSRLSQSTDVTFGHLVSGRFAAFEGAQHVVGPCLNVIPARIRLDTDQSFRDLLQQIHEQQVAAIPYEATPFDRIARQASWPASTRFASILQYQHLPDQEAAESEFSTASTWTIAGNAVYGGGLLLDSACWLMAWPPQANDHAAFRFTFCGETLSPTTAESILDFFFKTLHAINDKLEDKVSSPLSFSIDEGLLGREDHITPSSQQASHFQQSHCASSVPSSCRGVLERLKAIWIQVLHLSSAGSSSSETAYGRAPHINLDDSFFELGGDSISAAEVASLCTRTSFNLKLQDILDFPTLRLQTLLVSDQIPRPVRDVPKLHFSSHHKFN